MSGPARKSSAPLVYDHSLGPPSSSPTDDPGLARTPVQAGVSDLRSAGRSSGYFSDGRADGDMFSRAKETLKSILTTPETMSFPSLNKTALTLEAFSKGGARVESYTRRIAAGPRDCPSLAAQTPPINSDYWSKRAAAPNATSYHKGTATRLPSGDVAYGSQVSDGRGSSSPDPRWNSGISNSGHRNSEDDDKSFGSSDRSRSNLWRQTGPPSAPLAQPGLRSRQCYNVLLQGRPQLVSAISSDPALLFDSLSSETYKPKVRNGPVDASTAQFDATDEYRDDEDPGYRIRDLWESELLAEIAMRERGDPGAEMIPYSALFDSGAAASLASSYSNTGNSHNVTEQSSIPPVLFHRMGVTPNEHKLLTERQRSLNSVECLKRTSENEIRKKQSGNDPQSGITAESSLLARPRTGPPALSGDSEYRTSRSYQPDNNSESMSGHLCSSERSQSGPQSDSSRPFATSPANISYHEDDELMSAVPALVKGSTEMNEDDDGAPFSESVQHMGSLESLSGSVVHTGMRAELSISSTSSAPLSHPCSPMESPLTYPQDSVLNLTDSESFCPPNINITNISNSVVITIDSSSDYVNDISSPFPNSKTPIGCSGSSAVLPVPLSDPHLVLPELATSSPKRTTSPTFGAALVLSASPPTASGSDSARALPAEFSAGIVSSPSLPISPEPLGLSSGALGSVRGSLGSGVDSRSPMFGNGTDATRKFELKALGDNDVPSIPFGFEAAGDSQSKKLDVAGARLNLIGLQLSPPAIDLSDNKSNNSKKSSDTFFRDLDLEAVTIPSDSATCGSRRASDHGGQPCGVGLTLPSCSTMGDACSVTSGGELGSGTMELSRQSSRDSRAKPVSNRTSVSGGRLTTKQSLSDIQQAYDASRWQMEYCNGSHAQHRKKMKRLRQKMKNLFRYAESGEPFYPVSVSPTLTVDCFNLKVVFDRDRTGFQENRDFLAEVDSVIAGRYKVISTLGQAAFSKALRCLDTLSNEEVCVKVIKNEKDYVDQSLDEIQLLRYINSNVHSVDFVHCLRLVDYFYYHEHLFLVTELLGPNLFEFAQKIRSLPPDPKTSRQRSYYSIGRIQKIAYQILVALDYVHSLRLIHCDLKPENILLFDDLKSLVKMIDFGSSCFEDDQLSTYVQSRSYRAPEVLLGLCYDQKIDLWSFGCILAELWTGYVLFQNEGVPSMLARIAGIIGPLPYYMVAHGRNVANLFTQDGQLFVFMEVPPCPRRGKRVRVLLPKRSSLTERLRTRDSLFVDFLSQLLQIDPAKRPTAQMALSHPWLEPGRYVDGL